MLLMESLKDITDSYRHVLVYMRPPTTLLPEIKAEKVYYLGYKGKANMLWCIYKLHRIIKAEKAELIHAHHYWPTILSRLAKPASVPLLFTVHNHLSHDAFHLNRLSLYLEKLTYRETHHPIFVSKAVSEDYHHYIQVRGESTVIYNFVADEFYNPENEKEDRLISSNALRLVAVGNLKAQKNHEYLVKVFCLLKNEEIYLDLIGDGPLMSQMMTLVAENGLKRIKTVGTSNAVFSMLRKYDAFILASKYEGMSLAVIEAMAVGLPCILSDIPSNREVAGNAAVFFSLSQPKECADKIMFLLKNPELMKEMSAASKKKAVDYQKKKYLSELEALYKQYI